jgi:hypothetical protein
MPYCIRCSWRPWQHGSLRKSPHTGSLWHLSAAFISYRTGMFGLRTSCQAASTCLLESCGLSIGMYSVSLLWLSEWAHSEESIPRNLSLTPLSEQLPIYFSGCSAPDYARNYTGHSACAQRLRPSRLAPGQSWKEQLTTQYMKREAAHCDLLFPDPHNFTGPSSPTSRVRVHTSPIWRAAGKGEPGQSFLHHTTEACSWPMAAWRAPEAPVHSISGIRTGALTVFTLYQTER